MAAVAIMFFIMSGFGMTVTFIAMAHGNDYYAVFDRTMGFDYYIVLIAFLGYFIKAFGEKVLMTIFSLKEGIAPDLGVRALDSGGGK